MLMNIVRMLLSEAYKISDEQVELSTLYNNSMTKTKRSTLSKHERFSNHHYLAKV